MTKHINNIKGRSWLVLLSAVYCNIGTANFAKFY
jgi:hypothetical protein